MIDGAFHATSPPPTSEVLLEELYAALQAQPTGVMLLKGDLHVHTPISQDYKDQCTIYDILAAAVQRGLNFIALTDHNSCAGYAALFFDKYHNPQLNIFPGVEITAPGGKRNVHLLAIFESGSHPDLLNDLLARIGIPYSRRGQEDAVAAKEPLEIIAEIDAAGGLAIAAHSDADNGITGGMRGQQRIRLLADCRLRALELVNYSDARFFDGSDPSYPRRVACIQGSDSHSLRTIGERSFYVRMEEPTLTALRLAFLDPRSRLSLLPAARPYVISGLALQGGFLARREEDWFLVRFNEGMNSIIGGRGAGKSTLIEALRASFLPTVASTILTQYGFRSVITFVEEEGEAFAIVLSADGRAVYRRNPSSNRWEMAPPDRHLRYPRVYPQGAFYDMARAVDFFTILDREAWPDQAPHIEASERELSELSAALRSAKTWVTPDDAKLELAIVDVEARLRADIQAAASQKVKRMLGYIFSLSEIVSKLKTMDDHDQAILDEFFAMVRGFQQHHPFKRKLNAELRRALYNRFLRSNDAVGALELLTKWREARWHKGLSLQRALRIQTLLSRYLSASSKVKRLRDLVVKDVNAGCEGALEVQIFDRIHSVAYERFLRAAKVENSEIERLVGSVHPLQLLSDLLTGNRPVSATLMSMMPHESAFERFESCFSTEILIRLAEIGEFRPFDKLSIGQQCVVLLNILLARKDDNRPIIIDQPEDHLDNAYVAALLVPNLRRSRQARQLIFATHSANLAVLSDTDLYLILKASGTEGRLAAAGGIERETVREGIIEILEGGGSAVAARMGKYQLRM